MKQLLIICVFIFAFAFSFEMTSFANEKIIIVIDPGHGGKDPGTSYKNILEKNINLEISIELKKQLEKSGYLVYMTRDGDYDLSKPNALYRKKSDFDNRIKLINDLKTDLYLSIHLNYLNDSNYYGAQVFYDQNNKELASIIQEEINLKTNSNRKIKIIPNLYMYKQLTTPGVLIECGFLSNSSDRLKLQDNRYQIKLSKIIADAVDKYFNV